MILKTFKKFRKNKLASSSGDYFIATLFEKGIVFLTIPIFTRMLSTSEYGMLSVFQSLISILIALTSLGTRGAIIRIFYDSDVNFESFYSSIIKFFLIYIPVFWVISFLTSHTIASFFNIPYLLLQLSLVVAGFNLFIMLYLAELQAYKKSKVYSLVNISKTVLTVLLSILLIYLMENDKYYGRVYAYVLISILFFGYFLFKHKSLIKIPFNWNFVKKALNFGVPLMPHMIAGFGLAFFKNLTTQNEIVLVSAFTRLIRHLYI